MLISVHYDNEPIILNKQLTGHNYKYINGQIKNKKSCRGYCNYVDHRGCLTDKMINDHKCMEKACPFLFIPINYTDYEEKLRKKEAKKQRRMQNLDEARILELCTKILQDYDELKITKVRKTSDSTLEIRYVAVFSTDEDVIKKQLETDLSMDIILQRENYSFDTCVKIVYGR